MKQLAMLLASQKLQEAFKLINYTYIYYLQYTANESAIREVVNTSLSKTIFNFIEKSTYIT